ncbi:hypothetical protein J3D49_002849 [Pseudomonas kilonensis]|nr:hypothetical protein [Pseudomonas kilonensis]
MCISIAAVMAAYGSALTAGHFWKSREPDQPKVTKSALPHHSAPRLGSVCPHCAMPAFGQRGLTGRPRSKAEARRPDSRPGSWWDRVSPVGASLLAMTSAHPTSLQLNHRYREQARSHSELAVFTTSAHNTKTCGSELARDDVGKSNIIVDWNTAFASKLCSHRSNGCTTGRARSAVRPPRGGG